MKRIISVIITLLLLSSCLFITVSADNTDITFSDDYRKMYYDGYTYSRFNDAFADYFETKNVDYSVQLTAEQFDEVEVSVETNDEMTVFYAYFEFLSDGSTLEASFMRDDCLAEFENVLQVGADEYKINIGHYDYSNKYIEAKSQTLFGEEKRINGENIDSYYFSLPVTAEIGGGSIAVRTGEIIYYSQDFYYVDFGKSAVNDPENFDASGANWLETYVITDMDLCLQLEECYNEYYSEEFGFVADDDFTGSISNFFLAFLFAVIPFAILVTFLILCLRSKTIYKKFFAVICALAASELIIFVIIAAYIMMNK